MTIERVTKRTLLAWQAMRLRLWADSETDPHDIAALLERDDFLALMVRNDSHEPAGFAEASIRNDFVNGCETSPVLFLEGIYVEPPSRRHGFARALVDAVAQWGRERDVSEFASDALVDDTESHAMHEALGFEETERVVYFRKLL